ncbi:MAG: His/Gly/Thr/Pro-type tRNA ligase C-terminal domain-containing protein [Candidatus Zixiibacteriota bacterium]
MQMRKDWYGIPHWLHVHLLPINYKNDLIHEYSERLYADLQKRGILCLIDDRDLSPGVKFSDADLLGIPLQLTLGEKNLKNHRVEIKQRRSGHKETIPLSKVTSLIKQLLSSGV